MKLRSKDINIFSTSALDLFASAMGAFMLLAIMALPFFPNTGDSPERVADVKDALALVEQSLQQSEAALAAKQSQLEETQIELQQNIEAAAQATQELSRIKVPDLDVVICLDVTGSMRHQIDGLKREIRGLAQVLEKMAPSSGIGVVAFGDRQWAGGHVFRHDIINTDNLQSLERFIQGLQPNMGKRNPTNPDQAEALYDALLQAVNSSWRPQSKRRYIIVVTDNPAYPEEVSLALEAAQQFSRSEQQFVSTVMVGTHSGRQFLQALAEAGKGQFIDSTDNQPMFASILLAVMRS